MRRGIYTVEIIKFERLKITDEDVSRQVCFLYSWKVIKRLFFCLGEIAASALLLDKQDALPKKVNETVLSVELFTGSSKLATRRLVTPNTSKNSL